MTFLDKVLNVVQTGIGLATMAGLIAPIDNHLPRPSAPTGPNIPGFSVKDIQSMNVKHLRSANLPKNSFLWLFLPVIGWGILVYLKIDSNKKHSNAEEIMQKFDSAGDFDANLQILEKAKKAAGHLAEQYNFSAVQLYLIHNKAKEAEEIMPHIEGPKFPGQHSYSNLNLASPAVHPKSQEYHSGRVLLLTTRSYLEAQMTAAVYSANAKYLRAYEALNDAAYWAHKERLVNVNPRQQQTAIVKKLFVLATMEEQVHKRVLPPRLKEIIRAERSFPNDPISFAMKKYNLSFNEAIAKLKKDEGPWEVE